MGIASDEAVAAGRLAGQRGASVDYSYTGIERGDGIRILNLMKTVTEAAYATYTAARAEGLMTDLACKRVRQMHPEVSFEDVVALCWHIETGKPEPRWLHDDGTETQASRDWSRGFEKREIGE